MRRRLVVCLTFAAFASTGAAARESKLSDAGGSCSAAASRPVASRAADRATAMSPVTANKAKPAVRGGGDDDGNRLQSPRWHRFLPGMFR